MGDVAFSQSPLSAIINGNFLVCIFCTISGVVVSLYIFNKPDLKDLGKHMIMRYFRLMVPVFACSVLVFVFMKANLFVSEDLADITFYRGWIQIYYNEEVNLLNLLYCSLFKVWFIGDNTYTGAFWMLTFMFWGYYLSCILGIIGMKAKKKILFFYVLLVLTFFCVNYLYACFCLGTIIAYVFKHKMGVQNNKALIGIVCVVAGLFLGGFPTGVEPDNIYKTIMFTSHETAYQLYHVMGAFLVVGGIFLLDILQRFLSAKVFLKLGSVSYCVYIIQGFVMYAISYKIFLWLYNMNHRYLVDMAVVFGISTCLLLTLSWLFTHYIEKPASKLTNIFLEYFFEKQDGNYRG